MKLTDVKVVTAWKKTSMGFYFHLLSLSVAETHAGDDRTHAGTDEDEVGRLKGSEVKGSTVTQATSTHIYIKHTHTCIHLVVQPCHSAGPPGAIFQNHIIYVHTTTSTSSSSSLHSSIHRLFGSSVSSRLHIQTSLLVGVGKKNKLWRRCLNTGWLSFICYLAFLVVILSVDSDSGTERFYRHTRVYIIYKLWVSPHRSKLYNALFSIYSAIGFELIHLKVQIVCFSFFLLVTHHSPITFTSE